MRVLWWKTRTRNESEGQALCLLWWDAVPLLGLLHHRSKQDGRTQQWVTLKDSNKSMLQRTRKMVNYGCPG